MVVDDLSDHNNPQNRYSTMVYWGNINTTLWLLCPFLLWAVDALVRAPKKNVVEETNDNESSNGRRTATTSSSSTTTSPMMMTPSKPSFLFMLIDDIGWADFSYNNGTAQTPNIDKWAKRSGSIILQDMHSGGTVCSPTRATVLTGRNHFRDCVDYVYGCSDMTECPSLNFEFAPSQTFTIGDAVRSVPGADYDDGAYFAGKWHLGSFYNDSTAYGGRTSSPISHGFSHMNATVGVVPTSTVNCQCKPEWLDQCNFGHYNGSEHCQPHAGKDCCFNYWWDDPLSVHGVTNLTWPTPADDSLYLADAFGRFLKERRQKPFMAQISFHNCHIPFIGSPKAKTACADGETCRLPNPDDPPYTDEELDFYACLTELDNAVGIVLQALEQEGYYDNTLALFTADNGPEKNCPPTGTCQNADTRPHRPKEGPGSAGPLRGRKRDIYEGGHRVAGICSFPSVVPPASGAGAIESWETVTTMDFLPTIMEILDVDRPTSQQGWEFDGRSIFDLLKNPLEFRWNMTEEGPRQIGIGFYDPHILKMRGWGFRDGKWKYVEGSASCTVDECQQPQLYNLETDLGERHDLASIYPTKLRELQHKFQLWHASIMKSRREESKCQKVNDLPLPLSIIKQRQQEPLSNLQL